MATRLCKLCGITKATDDFYRRKSGSYSAECKTCAKARAAKWRVEHPDARAAITQRYRESHKEELKAAFVEHKKTDQFKHAHRERERLRRARVRFERYTDGRESVSFTGAFTRREWEQILAHFEHSCAICHDQKNLTLDHLTPLSRGGATEIGNIAPLCKRCNTNKGTRTIEELETFLPINATAIRHKATLQ